MNTSPEVRKAQKDAQFARIAAKGTPEYPALYAAQPMQVRKAAEQQAARAATKAARDAMLSQAEAEAVGAAAGFANLNGSTE